MFVHRMAVAAVCAAAMAAMGAGPAWEGKLDAPEWPDVTPHFYDAANDPACSVRGPYFGGAPEAPTPRRSTGCAAASS